MQRLREVLDLRFRLLVGLLLVIGFAVRTGFWLGNLYHIDEFITMLAAVMVAQKGAPILPSGLFYDHGLLFSFVSGLFVALVGFSETLARWPSVLVGTLTIPLYYASARRLFNSNLAGLMAAGLITFDGLAIAWSGRARMYALAHFFVLLSLLFLLQYALHRPSPKGRYLFLLFLAAALLSHTVTFLIVPPLLLTLLFFTAVYNRTWFLYKYIWLEVVAAALILGGVIWMVAQGQISSTVSYQDVSPVTPAPFGLEFLRGFLDPGLSTSRFDDLLDYFEDPDYFWVLPFIVLAVGVALLRVVRRQTQFADIAVLFLVMFVALVITEQAVLFRGVWQKSRYLFMTVVPAFLLVGGAGAACFLSGLGSFASKIIRSPNGRAWVKTAVPLLAALVLMLWWASDEWGKATVEGTGNYNSAFEYVRQNLQAGDKIMTIHPAAAYLFAGRSDYYANQVSAKVLSEGGGDEAEDAVVDRYVGGDFVGTVEQFNQTLAQNAPIWFVIDDARLYNRYDEYFTQQIFAQMDHVHRSGQIYIFRSNPHPVPVPPEPAAPLDVNFANLIRLNGYSLDASNIGVDGSISLGLFWRPAVDQPPVATMPKIFVQLRDRQNQVVAQADHLFYEGLLTLSEWQTLFRDNEWLRDTATLPLPADLSQGPYQIYVGLYDPQSLERVPIVNDTSGENAAIITLPDGW
jgi:4-amino-4-deoxy-L-arabinose transferase-like glycosyltransferase